MWNSFWSLFTVFSQIYSDRHTDTQTHTLEWGGHWELNRWCKNEQFDVGRNMYEDKVVGQTVPDKFATIVKVKMINANKNKLSTLHWENRKVL